MPDTDKKPENPEAFAFGFGTDNYSDIQRGMTLRDYFAAKAMQAIVNTTTSSEGFGISTDALSTVAYEVADAMLKQRAK